MAVHNDLIDKGIDKLKKYTHLLIQTTILNYAVRKAECSLKKLLSNNEVVDYRDNIYWCLCISSGGGMVPPQDKESDKEWPSQNIYAF